MAKLATTGKGGIQIFWQQTGRNKEGRQRGGTKNTKRSRTSHPAAPVTKSEKELAEVSCVASAFDYNLSEVFECISASKVQNDKASQFFDLGCFFKIFFG